MVSLWWYCERCGFVWKHHPSNSHDTSPDECPVCGEIAGEKYISGPFVSMYQAEFVYLKRLDDKRLDD